MTADDKTFCVLERRGRCKDEITTGCDECSYCADVIEEADEAEE